MKHRYLIMNMAKTSAIIAGLATLNACNPEPLADKMKHVIWGIDGPGGLEPDSRLFDPDHRSFLQSGPNATGSGLQTFDSCGALELALERHIERHFREKIEAQIAYANAYPDSSTAKVAVLEDQQDSSNGSAAPQAAPSGSPSSYTKTNNQIAGIQEGDIVKSTGEWLFHATGNNVRVVKQWPAEQLELAGSVEVAGHIQALLLDRERKQLIVAFAIIDETPQDDATILPATTVTDDVSFVPAPGAQPHSKTGFAVFDISTPTDPAIMHYSELNGYFRDARIAAGSPRITTSDWLALPQVLQSVPQYPGYYGMHNDVEEYEELLAQLSQIVAEPTLKDWLSRDLNESDCSSVALPEATHELNLLNVTTWADGNLHTGTLLAPANYFVATDDSFVVANQFWWWDSNSQSEELTLLYQADVTPTTVSFNATTRLNGTIINNFALDHHDGHLRVAITERTRQSEDGLWLNWNSFNYVVVLTKGSDGYLTETGRTASMAEGESIFAVRFFQDRAYVVTFLQVDPLFSIDLSNPESPTVLGELKIPGFSTYIHFIDQDTLLTIGMDENWGSAQKLSLFDVSNDLQPVELATHTMEREVSSMAVSDYKAFTFSRELGKLAIPASMWLTDPQNHFATRNYSALLLFDVSRDNGISPAGAVDMTNLTTPNPNSPWDTNYVDRGMFIDDYVYAFSPQGIKAASAQSPADEVASLKYDTN